MIGVGSKLGLGLSIKFLYLDNILNMAVSNLLRSYSMLGSGPLALFLIRNHVLVFQEDQV